MFDLADAPFLGAGEGARLVAEELAVEQGFGHAAAVDGNEIAVPARAQIVQAAGDQFLAGTGFAVDQDVGSAAGQAGQAVAQLLHTRRAADQLAFEQVTLLQLATQVAHLQHQPALFQRPADHLDQVFRRKRFLDKVVGAILHCLHGHRHVAVAGDQHHRQFRVEGQCLAQEGHAVHLGQADVADHDAAEVTAQSAPRLFGAAGALGGDAFELQRLLATQRNVRVILDDQYFQCLSHGGQPRRAGEFAA